MSDRQQPVCLDCGRMVSYDAFEDLYACDRCHMFWYPEELGVPPRADAGYLTLITHDAKPRDPDGNQ